MSKLDDGRRGLSPRLACIARAGFVFSLRAFFGGRAFFLSVVQDRLILPDGDQAIAIYRGAPACVDGRRGLSPRLTYCAADNPHARSLILSILSILAILLQTIAIKVLSDLFS